MGGGGVPEETGDGVVGGQAAEPVFWRGKGHGVGIPTRGITLSHKIRQSFGWSSKSLQRSCFQSAVCFSQPENVL